MHTVLVKLMDSMSKENIRNAPVNYSETEMKGNRPHWEAFEWLM